MTAEKLPRCLLSLKKANLFTAAHVSRNAVQRDADSPVLTSISTRKTHGQDEDATLKGRKRKSQLAFFKNTKRVKLSFLKHGCEASVFQVQVFLQNLCWEDSYVVIFFSFNIYEPLVFWKRCKVHVVSKPKLTIKKEHQTHPSMLRLGLWVRLRIKFWVWG